MTDLQSQIETYLRETSIPVDVDVLVTTPEVRSGTAVVAEPARRSWRPAVAFAVAALAVLLVGAPLLLLGVFSSAPVAEEPVTTTVPMTTTSAPETPRAAGYPVAAAEDDVAALHTAWNGADAEAVRALLGYEGAATDYRIATAIEGAEAKLEVQCEQGTATETGGVEIPCRVSLTADRFYTPAGVTLTSDVVYEVDETGIAWTAGRPFWSSEPTGEAREFLLAFDRWLFERHQQGQPLAGWIWVDPNNGLLPNWLDGHPCCPYSVETVAAARSVFALVDEFLAQPGDQWPVTPSPTAAPTTASGIVLETKGTVTTGIRSGRTLFTVTHDPAGFADVETNREPDGVLTTLGWEGSVWSVHEIVPGNEDSPGEYLQVEIHRLWPQDTATDVLWLTNYSGATEDTLTGYTPKPSDTFTLFDALVLEGGLDRFGLHPDCRATGGDIGAALLSFEGDTPVVIMAWTIDIETMTFVVMADAGDIEVGECFDPEPRN
jgi:hypothetical protein